MAFSSSNRYSANAFANSVLPTPVVPGVPTGFSCLVIRHDFFSRHHCLLNTSSWPTTRLCSSSSRCNSFLVLLQHFHNWYSGPFSYNFSNIFTSNFFFN
jgi:hypothetical protein